MSDTIDLSKSYDFFKPEDAKGRINIVGCGSVGSTVAENLARCGVTKFTLWDFDNVEPHNIVNQMFRQQDIGKKKVSALLDILTDINPEISKDAVLKEDGWNGDMMSGYIFLCVDSIELRREILELHKDNTFVKAVFDFRTLLESAQHYAADWSEDVQKENLLASMQFSHEEAKDETPVSACGVTLGVATTVRLVSALGVNNFINFVKGNEIKKLVIIDGFNFMLDAF